MNPTEGLDTAIADRYQVHTLLGKGIVGSTYQALDTATQQQVAIKVLSLRQMTDWKVLDLFDREAKVLERLNHPSIPKYIESFVVDTESDRLFYIVRQLAVGESLADLADKGWRATEAEIKNIAIQVLEILTYLHELPQLVIHRDIKPSNLIYQPDTKKVFLIDFGSVQDAFSHAIAGGTFVGTFGFMAPEQLRGKTKAASDLFSLGVTIACLLTHRDPADLPRKRLKIDFSKASKGISSELIRWLERVTEPVAEDRFPSARVALRAINSGFVRQHKKPEATKVKINRTRNRLAIELPSARDRRTLNIDSIYFIDQRKYSKYFVLLTLLFTIAGILASCAIALGYYTLIVKVQSLEISLESAYSILIFAFCVVISFIIWMWGRFLVEDVVGNSKFSIVMDNSGITIKPFVLGFYSKSSKELHFSKVLPSGARISLHEDIQEIEIHGDFAHPNIRFGRFLTKPELNWILLEIQDFITQQKELIKDKTQSFETTPISQTKDNS